MVLLVIYMFLIVLTNLDLAIKNFFFSLRFKGSSAILIPLMAVSIKKGQALGMLAPYVCESGILLLSDKATHTDISQYNLHERKLQLQTNRLYLPRVFLLSFSTSNKQSLSLAPLVVQESVLSLIFYQGRIWWMICVSWLFNFE